MDDRDGCRDRSVAAQEILPGCLRDADQVIGRHDVSPLEGDEIQPPAGLRKQFGNHVVNRDDATGSRVAGKPMGEIERAVEHVDRGARAAPGEVPTQSSPRGAGIPDIEGPLDLWVPEDVAVHDRGVHGLEAHPAVRLTCGHCSRVLLREFGEEPRDTAELLDGKDLLIEGQPHLRILLAGA